MPVSKIKKVWDYCTYNKPFFILILLLFCVITYIDDYSKNPNMIIAGASLIITTVFIFGYGMTITRDRISNGKRLPKIIIRDVLILGIQSAILMIIYLTVQQYLLTFICSPLNFPNFELEELIIHYDETLTSIYAHNPRDTLIFIIAGGITFYITAFFMEISLARLADTDNILSAINLWEIKKDIDIIGWRNYAVDYTKIALALAFFAALDYLTFPNTSLNYIWSELVYLFTFATQFLGIGAVYSKVKENKN